jgi:hypothetical protein
MAASMKMTALWDMAPYSLVEVDRSSMCIASIIRAIALMMEAKQHHILEGFHLL